MAFFTFIFVYNITKKIMYYRESFEYSPIKMFFNSNSADTIVSRGDVTFNLRRNINLPNNVIGYVSLNEMTIGNTDYNISANNNTLVLQDYLGLTQSITITPGNYTVTSLMAAMNTRFAALVGNNFANITVTYSDITNMYTLTTAAGTTHILSILATSTINSVLGFEPGLVNNSVANATMTRSSLKSPNQKMGTITVIAGTNDNVRITAPNGTALNITLTAGTSLNGTVFAAALNAKFITAGAGGTDCGIIASFDTTTFYFTFSCSVSGNVFTFLSTSTALGLCGLTLAQNTSSVAYPSRCTLTSTKIVDLSGNNSFYVSSNLGLANYSFLNPNNKGGANVLGKVQLTSSQTGIEFYNNLTAFKTRFYDTNITSIHIVLYDEDFNQWIPQSDWSMVLEFTFFEKYDLTTKLKTNNLLFSK